MRPEEVASDEVIGGTDAGCLKSGCGERLVCGMKEE
jgi:hypothetical protein